MIEELGKVVIVVLVLFTIVSAGLVGDIFHAIEIFTDGVCPESGPFTGLWWC